MSNAGSNFTAPTSGYGPSRADSAVTSPANPNILTRAQVENNYKRTLVEMIREVMHPPHSAMMAEKFAWSIRINRLLCELKSISSNIARCDIPPSFADIDSFVSEAWRFAVAVDVPRFYEKWPQDLDRLVEESFANGVPLGRMMNILPPEHATPMRGGTKIAQRSGKHRHRSAADSAVALGAELVRATPSTVTSGSTPSLDWRSYSTSTPSPSSSLRANSSPSSYSRDISVLASPTTRNFDVLEFERLVMEKNSDQTASGTSFDRTRLRPCIRASTPSISPSPVIYSTASVPPDDSPAPPHTIEHSARSRRSTSCRAWIPQPYHDGQTPAVLSELDDICATADALIGEAEDIDARDENEKGLKDWTSRARKCEVDGRGALARVSNAGLSDCDEVRYVASTLKLLKSAHVELIEFAERMLNPTRYICNAPQAYATSSQTTIRVRDNTGPIVSTSSSQITNFMTRSGQDLSRPSVQRRSVPFIQPPSVPWKWVPAPTSNESAPESNDKPDRSKIITSSIVIRTRRGTSGVQTTIKLQRMTDREPGDESHEPPCSACGERGFSCFGKPGKGGACRRCRRIRRGHCTYARLRVTNKNTEKAALGKRKQQDRDKQKETLNRKGKGKEKEQVNDLGRAFRRLMNVGAKGKGKQVARPNSEMLRKLRTSRLLEDPMDEDDNQINENEDEDEDMSDTDAPPLKRRRSLSPRPTHEPESDSETEVELGLRQTVPPRATSEPPDRASASVPTWMRRSRSRGQGTSSLTWNSSSDANLGTGSDLRDSITPTPLRQRIASFLERENIQPSSAPGLELLSIASLNLRSRTRSITRPRMITTSELESGREMEVEPEASTSAPGVDRGFTSTASVNTNVIVSTSPAPHPGQIPTPTSLPSPNQIDLALPQQAPSPSSLSSSSQLQLQLQLHSQSQNPSISSLALSSIFAKLDSLDASSASIADDVRGAQQRLARQGEIIREVREVLGVLVSPPSGEAEGSRLRLEDGNGVEDMSRDDDVVGRPDAEA
ncbi:uncharacterized protein FOMMEDRAFT_156606 [Fomitiporia mediterranea MF3/22]|uniref:uncharacterized protein n=1 Tax=Fomitiporia mediterranea (strain MF3/22) TaxID=694068 RepID=UPI0004408DBA|nr:uncharacterized protein FOMMEDRAFT_156606 [Fomitiporia mediterranea MF3/22]EJD03219.1 hypothetical protein FOMMEDRAFT_156606 [Fomitiporia mediterranea MF3/22]